MTPLVSLLFLSIFTCSLTTGLHQPTVEKRQASESCLNPADDPGYPALCTDTFAAIVAEITTLDIDQPPSVLNEASANFTSKLSTFCTEQCVRPQLDYFICVENTPAFNNLVNGICSSTGERFCISKVLDGISGGQISTTVYDPLFLQACTINCTINCYDTLQSSIDYLGCCAQGVFTVETSQVLQSCQLSLTEPCPSNFTMATTPPCNAPEVDPNYPAECVDALTGINNKLQKLFGTNFTIQEVNDSVQNISDLLVVYCRSECFLPSLDYLQCLVGDTETAESQASFQCGYNNGDFCLVQTLTGISEGIIPVEIFGVGFAEACTASCTAECQNTISSVIDYLGCCSRGLYTDLGVFRSCGLVPPENCPLAPAPTVPTDRTPPTGETEDADSSAPSSGVATIHAILSVLLAALCITTIRTIL